MSSIQEYVVQGGQAVTAGEVDQFRRQVALYKLKVETLEPVGQPKLPEQAGFLLRFIEDVLDDAYESADFAAVPEAIFAIRYLAKGVDIIPDSVAGGFCDDALVVRAVLEGHDAEFRAYAARNGLDYDALT